MPAKKKEPTMRWKVVAEGSWKNVWRETLELQYWSESSNKYLPVPVVQ